MAPAWESLATDWASSTVGLVAEVDCTSPDAEALCEELHVEAFPTLLYGDPSSPEEYQGGRDYASLSAFAKTFLDKPVCGISKVDSCTPEQQAAIQKVLAKSKDDLIAEAEKVKNLINEAQKDLDAFVDSINAQYEAKSNEFNEKVSKIKEESDFKWIQQSLTKIHGLKPQDLENTDSDDDEERDEL